MKIALCYFGNVGWMYDDEGRKNDLNPTALYQNNLDQLGDVEVDTFLHGWSNKFQEEIIQVFQPKAYLFESQINFNDLAKESQKKFNPSLKEKFYKFRASKSHDNFKQWDRDYRSKTLSRWYSTKKVLELMNEYSVNSNTKYDYVMLLRFDLEFYSRVDFDALNKKFIYCGNPAYWSKLKQKEIEKSTEYVDPFEIFRRLIGRDTIFTTQPNLRASITMILGINFWHLSDTWFLANPHNIKVFGLLYNDFHNYLPSPHISTYNHLKSHGKARLLRFYKSQWKDYDLYRQGKNGNKDII